MVLCTRNFILIKKGLALSETTIYIICTLNKGCKMKIVDVETQEVIATVEGTEKKDILSCDYPLINGKRYKQVSNDKDCEKLVVRVVGEKIAMKYLW